MGDEPSLGGHVARDIRFDPGSDQRANVLALGKVFDANSALPGRWHQRIAGDPLDDARTETQAVQAGAGEQKDIAFAVVETSQARVHVAAHGFEGELAIDARKQSATASARRADAGSRREVAQRPLLGAVAHDERIPRVRPRPEGDQRESIGQRRRHVLHAVNGDVGLVVQKGVLKRIDERALAELRGRLCASLRRSGALLVALGVDLHQLRLKAGRASFQLRRNGARLGERQLAAPRSDSDSLQASSSLYSRLWAT